MYIYLYYVYFLLNASLCASIKKKGYVEGQGLGKNNEGIIEPITLKSVNRHAKQECSDEAAGTTTGNSY